MRRIGNEEKRKPLPKLVRKITIAQIFKLYLASNPDEPIGKTTFREIIAGLTQEGGAGTTGSTTNNLSALPTSSSTSSFLAGNDPSMDLDSTLPLDPDSEMKGSTEADEAKSFLNSVVSF
eukprot:Awhi_evm2s2987